MVCRKKFDEFGNWRLLIKNSYRIRYVFLLIGAIIALLFLCVKPVKAEYTPPLKKKTLTLTNQNKTKKMTVKAGTIIRLKVKYKKKTVKASEIKFTSSKKKVAAVSAEGVITTKKAGKAVIKLKRKKKKQYVTLKLVILPADPVSLIESDEEVAAEEVEADTDIKNIEPAKAYTAQTSAFCAKHTHIWKPVAVENYPAEYCSKCGIERWIGSDELKKEAVVNTSRKFIMIGDSYGARSSSWGGNYTWPYQLCKLMGLGEKQAYISAKGGYGFATELTGGTRYFSDLLRLIDPDPKVTDIVIVGGVGNDAGRTKVEIQRGFIDITMEAFVRFPNARIIYAAPNIHISSADAQKSRDERRAWNKSFCMMYGWLYLDGCEKILPAEDIYFRADKHHPNEAGEEILGAGLIEKLKRFL